MESILGNMNHILIYGINTVQYESYVDIWSKYCAIWILIYGINTVQYESYVDIWNQYCAI